MVWELDRTAKEVSATPEDFVYRFEILKSLGDRHCFPVIYIGIDVRDGDDQAYAHIPQLEDPVPVFIMDISSLRRFVDDLKEHPELWKEE